MLAVITGEYLKLPICFVHVFNDYKLSAISSSCVTKLNFLLTCKNVFLKEALKWKVYLVKRVHCAVHYCDISHFTRSPTEATSNTAVPNRLHPWNCLTLYIIVISTVGHNATLNAGSISWVKGNVLCSLPWYSPSDRKSKQQTNLVCFHIQATICCCIFQFHWAFWLIFLLGSTIWSEACQMKI